MLILHRHSEMVVHSEVHFAHNFLLANAVAKLNSRGCRVALTQSFDLSGVNIGEGHLSNPSVSPGPGGGHGGDGGQDREVDTHLYGDASVHLFFKIIDII